MLLVEDIWVISNCINYKFVFGLYAGAFVDFQVHHSYERVIIGTNMLVDVPDFRACRNFVSNHRTTILAIQCKISGIEHLTISEISGIEHLTISDFKVFDFLLSKFILFCLFFVCFFLFVVFFFIILFGLSLFISFCSFFNISFFLFNFTQGSLFIWKKNLRSFLRGLKREDAFTCTCMWTCSFFKILCYTCNTVNSELFRRRLTLFSYLGYRSGTRS